MKTILAATAITLFLTFSASSAEPIDFTRYHEPDEIDAELRRLAEEFEIAKLKVIGYSRDNRPIQALKISDDDDQEFEKDIFFVGMHNGQQRIAAEMCLYLAEYLVKSYGSDAGWKSALDNVEVWIVPVLNPDGYRYFRTGEVSYWFKNVHRDDNGNVVGGVNLNRNYNLHWGDSQLDTDEERPGWGSDNPDDDFYVGPFPFSEPETRALRDLVVSQDDPVAMLVYYGGGEAFLRPWRFTDDEPWGERTLEYIASDSIDRIEREHGHIYLREYPDDFRPDNYPTGTPVDFFWFWRRMATFSVAMRPPWDELRENPFVAEDQIIANNEENLAAALALIRDAAHRRAWIQDHVDDRGERPSAVWGDNGWSQPFWISPDIRTDPEDIDPGDSVTLNILVHNGGGEMTGCTIAAYYTDPCITLQFPTPHSVLIDEKKDVTLDGYTSTSIPPMVWNVPTEPNSFGQHHWCVGVVVYHSDDRPLTTQVAWSDNLACRNFNTEPVKQRSRSHCFCSHLLHRPFLTYEYVPRRRALGARTPVFSGRPPFHKCRHRCPGHQPILKTFHVGVTNDLDVEAAYKVIVDRESLACGWKAWPVLPANENANNRKARLLGVTGPVLEPGESATVPICVQIPANASVGTVQDVHVHGALIPLVPGDRPVFGNGYTFQVHVVGPAIEPYRCHRREFRKLR